MHFPGADGETVGPVVCLGPPTVEDGAIESAVKHDFLAAGAGCLQRAARIVQPDIDPLHDVPAQVDVVILEDDQSAHKRLGLR